MNNSAEEVLGSIINADHIKGGDLFYIGTGIGLSSGLLCACIIAHANYYKRKHTINTSVVNDDETFIKELFAKGEIIQVI
jgi:hypothetical protein